MKAVSEYLASIGRKGGKASTEAKAIAARANASLPPGPGKRPRGRPKKKHG